MAAAIAPGQTRRHLRRPSIGPADPPYAQTPGVHVNAARHAVSRGRRSTGLGASRGTDGGPRPAPRPAASPVDGLLRDIKAFVEDHLADADLSPASIAAAHHISVRYLHHLFQRDRRSVGAYVRRRRLERCRADLVAPALVRRGVGQVGRRWGFRDPAVFSRAFKSAYGVTPGGGGRARRGGGGGGGGGGGPPAPPP
ncbi:helix-turn-helix domain-containing protein, partial [Streptomyces sp. NPDC127064]|uniref:helix-turn-helix domain-containing protein n=1 Tax=Streptomyces sp. NPDC127064 TaxID=3347124 RepID=UPI00365EBFEA